MISFLISSRFWRLLPRTVDASAGSSASLANLRVMNPYGTDLMSYDGRIVDNESGFVEPEDPKVKSVRGGGIEWTIKDGIPYHGPTLLREVKSLVDRARAAKQP